MKDTATTIAINAANPERGKKFQNRVQEIAEKQFQQSFKQETEILIGSPERPHRFDVVSEDQSIIIECKCYTWTDTGKVPVGKIAALDEALLFMHAIHQPAKKIIAMKRDYNSKRDQTIAEYFYDVRGHLLKDVSIWEIQDNDDIRIMQCTKTLEN